MKKLFLMICVLIPMLSWAQTDQKYINPLPVENGKIVFNTELKAPTLSQKEIYDVMYNWAKNRFTPDEKMNARIIYTDESKGIIVATGEEYLVFSSSMLSLDRTRIYYQFEINCKPEKLNLKISKIRYWYEEMRNGGERYKAEEWISDKTALNKAKTKLLPMSGKFRRKTIDLKDEIAKSAQDKIGELLIAKNDTYRTLPKVTIASNDNKEADIATKLVIAKDKAKDPQEQAEIINQEQPRQNNNATDSDSIAAKANRITITSGNDEQFEIGKECWGGFGSLFGKKVAFCLIDTQKTMANMLLAQNDNYTISFYTPGKSEAAMVVKCKKMSAQQISGEEANKMNDKNDASKKYNMYVGEIIK